MKNITTNEFDKTISEGIVLIDFYADWCGPCKMLSPVLEDLSSDYNDKITFVKVDVDTEMSLAERFGIMSIPTVKVFKDGEEIKSFMGYMPKPAIKTLLDQIIA